MEGAFFPFLEIQLSFHITRRTALSISENVVCFWWCQADAPTLIKPADLNRWLDPTIVAESLPQDALKFLRT
jgi:hypothetical protein